MRAKRNKEMNEDQFETLVMKARRQQEMSQKQLEPKVMKLIEPYNTAHNEAMKYKEESLAAVYAKYPYFFAKNMNLHANIPVGWIKHLEVALDKFAATGLNIVITELKMDTGVLEVKTHLEQLNELSGTRAICKQIHAAKMVLEGFLSELSKVCILCGRKENRSNEASRLGRSRDEYCTCTHCEKLFAVKPVQAENQTFAHKV